MDEECSKPSSDFLSKKLCVTRVDGGVDRISELPDEILLMILSFLHLREAAATSVLCSRWSDLRKHTPNLDFNNDRGRNQTVADIPDYVWGNIKLMEWVNLVIRSHKARFLKKFRIAFPVVNSGIYVVTKWLRFVFSRRVESLELDFRCPSPTSMVVLEESLRTKSILRAPPRTRICFQSLKRLCLKWLTVSGEDIELFVCNCPLLEQLTIHWAILTSDVEICGTTLMLKDLDIYGCSCTGAIKVCAPNLICMRIGGGRGRGRGRRLLIENVPKLVEADITFVGSDSVVPLFASSQLQILNISLQQSELRLLLKNGFPEMPNLKKLVIYCCGYYHHTLLPITALIWASPRLEDFKLKYIEYGANHEPERLQVISNDGRSPHQHLKRFEYELSHGPIRSYHTAELVTYISNNCVVLRKIIVGSLFRSSFDYTTYKIRLNQLLQGKVPNHIELEVF